MHAISSREEFDTLVKDTSKIVVVDFYATWCGPCKLLAPKLEEFVTKYPSVTFAKVDVDDLNEIAEAHQIHAMPTIIIFKNGVANSTITGANVGAIEEAIKKAIA